MYFVLSGMFFKDYGGFIGTFIKKANKLLLPYILFFFWGYLLHNTFTFILNSDDYVGLSTILRNRILPNNPIWFLRCLFFDTMIFLTICNISKNRYFRFLCSCGFGIIGYVCYLNDIMLPLSFSIAFSSMPFFGFGYLLRTSGFFQRIKLIKVLRFVLIPSMFLLAILSLYIEIPRIALWINKYEGVALLCHFISIVMVIGFLLILQLIGRIPGISYVGRYSIVPFGVHYPILTVLWKVCNVYSIEYNRVLVVLLFAITLAISVALIPLFTRLFPHFTAQKDLIHINPEGAGFFRRIKFAM